MSYFEIIERLHGYLVSKSVNVEPMGVSKTTWKERFPILRAVIPQRSVVLMIDDDSDQLAIFKRALTQNGYTVVGMQSAGEAIELAKQRDFHVIVVDFMMPEMTGLEFISKLRYVPDGGRNHGTPAILLTASDQDMELLAVQQGADMFCEKYRAQSLLPKQIQFLLESYIANDRSP